MCLQLQAVRVCLVGVLINLMVIMPQGTRARGIANEPAVHFPVQGFNYDYSKGAMSKVENVLNGIEVVVNQTQFAFQLGFLGKTSGPFSSTSGSLPSQSSQQHIQIRQFLYTQIQSETSPTNCGVMISESLTGYPYGYLRRQNEMIYFELEKTVCDEDSVQVDGSECFTRNEYNVTNQGAPTSHIRSVGSVQHNFAVSTSSGEWRALTPALFRMDAAVMFARPLTNFTHQPIGTASAILFDITIDEVLRSLKFGSSTSTTNVTSQDDSQVVFVTSQLTQQNYVVGASVPGVAFSMSSDGFLESVAVNNCSHLLIRRAAVIVANTPDTRHNDHDLLIASGLLIQQPAVVRQGLHWHVISARVSKPVPDYCSMHSRSFIAFVAVSATVMFCILLLLNLIRHHAESMRLWNYAHPPSLYGILFANAICLLYATIMVTEPTNSQCQYAMWFRVIALTLVCVSLLAKIELMAFAAVTLDLKLTSAIKNKLWLLFAAIATQLILVALQTLPSATSNQLDLVEVVYAGSSGQLLQRRKCKHVHVGLEATTDFVIGMLCLVAVYRSWQCRAMSKTCDESRGLFIAAAQAALMCGVLIGIRWGNQARNTYEGTAWLESSLVLWYVATMMGFVFGPRVYRHFTRGDLTVSEIRDMIKSKSKNLHSGSTQLNNAVNVVEPAFPGLDRAAVARRSPSPWQSRRIPMGLNYTLDYQI